MAILDFYATKPDLEDVIEFLIAETDVRIFEMVSRVCKDLREFTDLESLAKAFKIGIDKSGNRSVHLQLWSPSVMRKPRNSRVKLNTKPGEAPKFRYDFYGAGLIQLYLGGIGGKKISHSHFGHGSQARADAWGSKAKVDWQALMKLFRKIQYQIRRKMAVAKISTRPILHDAYQHFTSGFDFEEAFYSIENIES